MTITTSPEPVTLCRDENDQPIPKEIQTTGGPPLDAEYRWEISNPVVATLDPIGSGLCPNQPQCNTMARAGDQAGIEAARVTIRCTTTGAVDLDEIFVANPRVEILGVDVCGNQIQTRLEPVDPRVGGQLIFRMIGADGSRTEFFRAERGGGTYTDSFDFARLPLRVELTEIEAEWKVGDCETGARDREAAHFLSLGQIRHTQYNCPSSGDATCAGGGDVDVCFSSAQCQYDGPAAVPGTWLTQVTGAAQGTGCGSVPGRGIVQIEAFCLRTRDALGNLRFPLPPACQGHSVFREGGAIDPACHTGVGADTVAVDDGYLNGLLPCGTNICIFNGAGAGTQKSVTDRCPGCGLGRIDNFSNSGDCGIGDFAPAAVTLRLY